MHTMTLTHKNGGTLAIVPVVRERGGLAVHKSVYNIRHPEDTTNHYWCISHIASGGHMPYLDFTYRAEALRALDALQDIGVDWSLGMGALIAATKGTGMTTRLRAIAKAACKR